MGLRYANLSISFVKSVHLSGKFPSSISLMFVYMTLCTHLLRIQFNPIILCVFFHFVRVTFSCVHMCTCVPSMDLGHYVFQYRMPIQCAAVRPNHPIVRDPHIHRPLMHPRKLYLVYFWAMHRTVKI